jgi:hypothetical protein
MHRHRTPTAIASGLARAVAAGLACLVAAACGAGHSVGAARGLDASIADSAPPHVRVPYDGQPQATPGPRTPVHAEFTSDPIRTDTMQLMFAAGEMQTGGEPFANLFAGRDLTGFVPSRYLLPTDQYWSQGTNGVTLFTSVTDLFGYSTAVESYEYSKYHMNIVANQSAAGVSLINGPVIASYPIAGGAGATPFEKLKARMAQLIAATGADVSGYATLPAPPSNPRNDFGFPGLWPNMAPYRSFDVTMAPPARVVNNCTSLVGYGGTAQYGNSPVFSYECDYNLLRLTDRNQAEHVVGPGVIGMSTWKEALWAIDFTGRLHDAQTNQVAKVAPGDVPLVGRMGNTVQGIGCSKTCVPRCPQGCQPGVFIGSTPLEGMWGLTMVEEMDNAAAWILSSLATGDGATLSGFESTSAAIRYDYGSPLLWFPTAVAVTEQAPSGLPAGTGPPEDRYPAVSALSIVDGTSRAVDLAALAQGFSLFFGMTDARNVVVGQQIGMQLAFSGFLFAADDGLPDGESSAHDRALGVMRVAFVDLDRLHVDPSTGVVVDTATVGGGNVVRGTTTSATSLGHVVVGLRHLLMACNASVSQYGAPDADPSKDADGILNSVPISPPPSGSAGVPGAPTFSARVRAVLMGQTQFVLDTLTSADGTVRNGASRAGGAWSADGAATTLEAQSAALRVLVEAWFLTHDVTYQDRARAVARSLFSTFWSGPARMFRGMAGGPDEVTMTPERFAWLQQALRETYEALWIPGDPLLDRTALEDVIARVNKLYLNGWDDLNGDQHVDKPGECLAARLQLGEESLTGEIGHAQNGFPFSQGPDRDSDCVINTAYSLDGGTGGTASVLAGEVHFHSP